MATTRGVRIVSDGTRRGTDVFDLETGDKLLRVYSIHIEADATTGQFRTRIVSGDAFEYEGPAEIVPLEEAEPEEARMSRAVRRVFAEEVIPEISKILRAERRREEDMQAIAEVERSEGRMK